MKKLLPIILLLSLSNVAFASDIKFDPNLVQGEFNEFVKDFGVALWFNPMAPAETLGVIGFDISIESSFTDVGSDKPYWKNVLSNSDSYSYIPVPRLHVQKGLPFNIDIGAMYVAVPDSNIKIWGLEAKYAILEGSVVTPAVSVRASYSKLQGVDELAMDTKSLDLLISKGFLMFTPYAGVSMIKINGSEDSNLVTLTDVDETETRILLGLQVSPFPLLIVNAEASFGNVSQYALKIGMRF
jgi:hypothetical protein